MLSLLGQPRSSYDDDCREMTNPVLKGLIAYESVGPFKVRGLKPAVDSLRQILTEVQATHPDIYAELGHRGMLCVRLVRGSTSSISNHSWGTAIDLTLDGVLDIRGDSRVQKGLIDLAAIFNRHGWFWGAGFRTEDAMHFECGEDLIRAWKADGRLGTPGDGGSGADYGGGGAAMTAGVADEVLSVGDRGPEVATLQRQLNAAGANLTPDGIFGNGTKEAVIAFQTANGLTADGMAGSKTRAKLPQVA